MDKSRNLLFGVLATQLNKVSLQSVARAGAAWRVDPSRDLPERLVGDSSISGQERDLVVGLMERAIDLHNDDAYATLQAFGGEDAASKLFDGSSDLTDILGPADLSNRKHASNDDLPTEVSGRYQDISEHARGGAGRVLVVHDRNMQREVALKVLDPGVSLEAITLEEGQMWRPGDQMEARFSREARITGQLEHPSILPVYELGRRSDGTLYYTMKLVRGKTMAKAIEEAPTLRERLELLSHYLDLCQAIAYAHSKGIIHRDIKPANIMIGEFGETLVIDWGLAKNISQESPDPPSSLGVVNSTNEEEDEDPGLTRVGQYLGTPQYMSPEQALGDLDRVGPASDVFALGAVLFELLTGTPRFNGKSVDEIVAKAAKGESPPVTSLTPQAPSELVAICERALHRDAEKRYPSARELAGEIQRFQTGAMVQAYEYTAMDRLRRFARKHSAVLLTTSAALLVLLCIGVLAAKGILEEKARTEYELYRASLGLAMNAVKDGRFKESRAELNKAPARFRHLEWGLLQHQSSPDVMILEGDTLPVRNAYFSPDGSRIVTVGVRDLSKTWDSSTGELLKTVQLPRNHAWISVRSPDGRFHATVSRDARKVITLSDSEISGQPRILKDHPNYVIEDMEFSPDSKSLLTCSRNGIAILWDAETLQERLTLEDRGKGIARVTFSPDGRLIATGGSGAVRWWDARSGKVLGSLEGHKGAVYCVAFSPDGKLLASAGQDHSIRVWELASGDPVNVIQGHTWQVYFISFSPDGRRLVTAGDDNTAVVWNTFPTEEPKVLDEHTGTVNAVAFSPDGAVLATGGGNWNDWNDRRALLWDVRTRRLLKTLTVSKAAGGIASLAYFPEGDRLVTGNGDGSICIWATATGEKLLDVKCHKNSVVGIAVSPDGTTIATASFDSSSALWNVDDGRMIAKLNGSPTDPSSRTVDTVALSPDGRLVATGARDDTLRLWKARTGEPVLRIDTGHETVSGLAFSPDGKTIATGGYQGKVRFWDPKSGNMKAELPARSGAVQCLVYSQDGQRLLVGAKGNTVRIWATDTLTELAQFERHAGSVTAIAISPDERYLATGSTDTTAILWPIFPWKDEDLVGQSDMSHEEALERYKRTYWNERLAANSR